MTRPARPGEQIPTVVAEDLHFGGWTVDHGGSGSYQTEGGVYVSHDAYIAGEFVRFDLTTGEHACWRVEISPDRAHARRVAANTDLISAAILGLDLGHPTRIDVTFHDDGTATITDYDYRRFDPITISGVRAR